jgi:hypothetical protein
MTRADPGFPGIRSSHRMKHNLRFSEGSLKGSVKGRDWEEVLHGGDANGCGAGRICRPEAGPEGATPCGCGPAVDASQTPVIP